MPTRQRDPETNSLFKQLLLREHSCKGHDHCLGYDATSSFCDRRSERKKAVDEDGVPKKDVDGREIFEQRVSYSYVWQWRLFEAKQAALANKADKKIHKQQRFPVLTDTTACRSWWLAGAKRGGEIHSDFVPLLATALRLPNTIVWEIMRLACNFRDREGNVICVVNRPVEIPELRKTFGMDVAFTSTGVHDEQLTVEEYLAWGRMELASRLETMAEARHRPRPGNIHPEALPDDPDGVQGGLEAEEAKFDKEEGLPGGNDSDIDDTTVKGDPSIHYKPARMVASGDFLNVLHRKRKLYEDAKNVSTLKYVVMKKIKQDHDHIYKKLEDPVMLKPSCPSQTSSGDINSDSKAAFKNQQKIIEEKGREADENARLRQFAVKQQARIRIDVDEARSLKESEIPLSPFQMAVPLIARAGIWRSKEQYLATIYLLLPVQLLWLNAMYEGTADLMKDPGWLAQQERRKDDDKRVRIRRMFTHGPGGSGKTYFLTEVVLPVARHFFGEEGTKAIAAHNSAARLLHGSTMHSAGKMRRQQSMKPKMLRPKGTVKKALEKEWSLTACLVADELGLAAPKLVAAVSRRAFHARAPERGYDQRKIELAVEHAFGDVPVQVAAADMMQLNPVRSHSLVEAYCTSKVPGVPATTTEEDQEGYDILKKQFSDVVLFTGSHRFVDKDLPKLLNIMATPGGAKVPNDLRERIMDRFQAGPGDPRIQIDYVDEANTATTGFFAFGVQTAIQWDQVMRMKLIQILQEARVSQGPDALCNNGDGMRIIEIGSESLAAEKRFDITVCH